MSQVIKKSSPFTALCVQPVKWLSMHPQRHLADISLPYQMTHFCTQLGLAAYVQQYVSVTQSLSSAPNSLCSLLTPYLPFTYRTLPVSCLGYPGPLCIFQFLENANYF